MSDMLVSMCAEHARLLFPPRPQPQPQRQRKRQGPCRQRTPKVVAALLGVALLGAAAPAAAGEPEELFEKGLADLQAGRFGTACPALRKSYRFEKRQRTLFYLAECEERAGRIATAALHYDEFLDAFERLSPPEQKDEADRQKLALERREKLDADIPRVTFRLPETAPVGTKVTRSSKASPDPVPVVLGIPLPIDPGEQWVRTEASGGPARDKRFFVNKRERLTIELTVAEAGDARKTVRYSSPIEQVPSVLPPSLEDGPSGGRIAMYVAGGVGLAALATGVITGAAAWSQKNLVSRNCRRDLCNAEGERAADLASTTGAVSTVAIPIGITGLVIAAVFFVAEPKQAVLGSRRQPMTTVRSVPVILVNAYRQREAYVGGRWSW
ncbi:hypothetical protein WME99_39140 [Sorangium sp. So ce136]|uniref:hypothetical protein n=1 Tax=Sorangium sp. So ce136 TaxID=3133284 RepID=UPI003F08DC18